MVLFSLITPAPDGFVGSFRPHEILRILLFREQVEFGFVGYLQRFGCCGRRGFLVFDTIFVAEWTGGIEQGAGP